MTTQSTVPNKEWRGRCCCCSRGRRRGRCGGCGRRGRRGRRSHSVGGWMIDVGHYGLWVLDEGQWVMDDGRWMLDVGRWMMVARTGHEPRSRPPRRWGHGRLPHPAGAARGPPPGGHDDDHNDDAISGHATPSLLGTVNWVVTVLYRSANHRVVS